jgi:hypothetical protein
MLARSSLTLVIALSVTGCVATSNYKPANSPRVSVTDGGIYKNGKKYNDLLDAVADNPRALEEARTAKSIAMTGNWLAVGAVAVGAAGGVTLATNENSTTKVTGQSLLAGAIVVGIVALFVGTSAGPHWLNAIKIYNDDVDAKMHVKRPAPAPTGTPATPPPGPH